MPPGNHYSTHIGGKMGIDTINPKKGMGANRRRGFVFCLFLTLTFTFVACDDEENSKNNIHKDNKKNHNNDNNVAKPELFLPLAMVLDNLPASDSEQSQTFVPFLDDSYPEATPKQLEQLDRIKKRKTTKSISLA
ncbi:MAG: hypothetical protein FWB81_02175, partial [Cystobacterineae bacterium]|nr:hypothetical protein [Cystobacterineae bacterium]